MADDSLSAIVAHDDARLVLFPSSHFASLWNNKVDDKRLGAWCGEVCICSLVSLLIQQSNGCIDGDHSTTP
jgi:hypothetical protein